MVSELKCERAGGTTQAVHSLTLAERLRERCWSFLPRWKFGLNESLRAFHCFGLPARSQSQGSNSIPHNSARTGSRILAKLVLMATSGFPKLKRRCSSFHPHFAPRPGIGCSIQDIQRQLWCRSRRGLTQCSISGCFETQLLRLTQRPALRWPYFASQPLGVALPSASSFRHFPGRHFRHDMPQQFPSLLSKRSFRDQGCGARS